MDMIPYPLEPHPSTRPGLTVVFAIGILVIVIQSNLICNHLMIPGFDYQDPATSVSLMTCSLPEAVYRERNE